MAKKLTKRKAVSFLRSYYDVLNEIPKREDKLTFLESVLDKLFTDENPKGLNFIVNLSYESQRHSIEKSVKGYKDKTKTDLLGNPLNSMSYTPPQDPYQGGGLGGCKDPRQQEQEEEEEQEKYNNKPSVKKPKSPIDFVKLLAFINTTQKREGKDKFKVINKSVQGKYKARIKDGYTSEQIANSIINSAEDNYHKETNYKYLTPEFFSRSQTIDKHGFKTKANKSKISKENFSSNDYGTFEEIQNQ